MSVVGSETGMEARRVDADSSGARDGGARLSVRPLRGVELQLSEEALRSPVPRAAAHCRSHCLGSGVPMLPRQYPRHHAWVIGCRCRVNAKSALAIA